MRLKPAIIALLITTIALLGVLWVFSSKEEQHSIPLTKAASPTPPVTNISPPQQAPGSPTPTPENPKDTAMKAGWAAQNSKSMDTYGKVIDQFKNPVPDVKVTAGVGLYISMTQSGGNKYYTKTDADGRFQFTGIHGAGVGFLLEKEGYEWKQTSSSSRPENYLNKVLPEF